MRHVISASLALLVAFPAFAADQKPNTLTPQEIAHGWLLLFDGETTFGWQIDGEAKVEKGVLILGSKTRPTTAIIPGVFRDFELRLDAEGSGPFNLDYGRSSTGLGFGAGTMILRATAQGDPKKPVHVQTRRLPTRGKATTEVSVNYHREQHATCRLEVKPGEEVRIFNVKARPENLQSLFNSKDLTGWKEHPGRKSKFTVTKEGWLNVKDGPGDLQTEGQWANFVLQLECISNGKHLNSGIFFRCRPNEYQQGYEAQIRNQFTESPTQKYVVEEYDPKTHELKGKKEVQSPAVDYGTGAIYRRQPARRGVAKDGEWFTLTVVAHGRHFATWVNGIQVTDWTDHRKPNDNARNGYRAEKGPISIQGHDPTTDLSFRNLRIVELP